MATKTGLIQTANGYLLCPGHAEAWQRAGNHVSMWPANEYEVQQGGGVCLDCDETDDHAAICECGEIDFPTTDDHGPGCDGPLNCTCSDPVAVGRPETDPCQRGTVGCSVDHIGNSECATW